MDTLAKYKILTSTFHSGQIQVKGGHHVCSEELKNKIICIVIKFKLFLLLMWFVVSHYAKSEKNDYLVSFYETVCRKSSFVQHYAAHFKDALKFWCVSNFMVVQSREVRGKEWKAKTWRLWYARYLFCALQMEGQENDQFSVILVWVSNW